MVSFAVISRNRTGVGHFQHQKIWRAPQDPGQHVWATSTPFCFSADKLDIAKACKLCQAKLCYLSDSSMPAHWLLYVVPLVQPCAHDGSQQA